MDRGVTEHLPEAGEANADTAVTDKATSKARRQVDIIIFCLECFSVFCEIAEAVRRERARWDALSKWFCQAHKGRHHPLADS
jgi:hypothetical protein